MLFEPHSLPVSDAELQSETIDLWALNIADLPGPPGAENITQSRGRKIQQQRFLQRFYLRLILAKYLEIPASQLSIRKTPQGKPFVSVKGRYSADPPLYFSLSHVAEQLLIAVCKDYPVGVDMESLQRVVRQPLQVARRYFHPAEAEWLGALDVDQIKTSWLRMWTCKEAVVKATGGGIVSGLDRFAVSFAGSTPQITAAVNSYEDDILQKLKLQQFQMGDQYLIALAQHQMITHVTARQLQSPLTVPR